MNFVFVDIPLLVLVTKIDKVCSDVDKDVEEVFFSNAVKKTVDKVSDVIAIPRSHVLPVKNYEKEEQLKYTRHGSFKTGSSVLSRFSGKPILNKSTF